MSNESTPSRRKFIINSTIGAGMLSSLGSLAFKTSTKDERIRSGKRHLKMAGYETPRVAAFFNQSVEIEGCTYEFQSEAIGNLNTDTFSGEQTYDVLEIGLHPYILAYANDNFRDYTLLPIFPLRLFRHKSIYINTESGITRPEDLKGRRIGTPGYSSTSLTWIRGFMQDEYGIKPEDITWVAARKDSSKALSGKTSKQENVYPDSIEVVDGPEGMDESEMLVSGNVDALFHAAAPAAFLKGDPKVAQLFSDSRATEQAYYRKTGIFPIMHAVAVRKTLLEESPELAQAVFDAWCASKAIHFKYMSMKGWAYESLPWYGQEVAATQQLMGKNFWPYGLDGNRKSLNALFRYSYEQGMSKRQVTIKDLFHAPSFDFKDE